MEASEKHSSRSSRTAPAPSALVDDRIVIEDLTVTDEETARVVAGAGGGRRGAGALGPRAIEIGTRVLDREDTAIEVDYVRREFERLTRAANETIEERNRETVERIEDGLRRALGGEEAPGALGQALDAHSEELSERIAATFGEDREGAVQAQIKRMLEQRDEEFLDRLSAEDARNPLAPILASLRNWAQERRRTRTTATRSSRRSSTSCSTGPRSWPGSIRAARPSRRLRRPAPARAEASRSASTGRSSASPPPGATPRPTRAARAPKGGGKKGDTLIELGAANGPPSAGSSSRPRTSGSPRTTPGAS